VLAEVNRGSGSLRVRGLSMEMNGKTGKKPTRPTLLILEVIDDELSQRTRPVFLILTFRASIRLCACPLSTSRRSSRSSSRSPRRPL
jgi:hypothetical protein